jgi:hypothetical protein
MRATRLADSGIEAKLHLHARRIVILHRWARQYRCDGTAGAHAQGLGAAGSRAKRFDADREG